MLKDMKGAYLSLASINATIDQLEETDNVRLYNYQQRIYK